MPGISDLTELNRIRYADRRHWGSKAGALGELLGRGFPVPDGVCLSIQAYQRYKAALQLPSGLANLLEAAAKDLLWVSPFLAVRSSASAEDLPGASYAGVYQSVIGVSHSREIVAAVRTVWESYSSPTAAAVRRQNQGEREPGGMGVLIQPVIEAEAAGVCYSIDPVQPESGQMVISAAWGLGVGVVDGSVPADTIWLRRDDLSVLNRRLVEKSVHLALDRVGGLVRRPVPAEKARIECIPEAWACRTAQFALACEQVFERPQDVEWAVVDGKIWILQSRPIASLHKYEVREAQVFPIEWESPEQSSRFWTRTRIERQGTRPLLPLDIDTIRLLESTRLETCLRIGVERNEDQLAVNGHIFSAPAEMPVSKADLSVRRQAYLDLQERLVEDRRTSWDHWGPEIEKANQRLAAIETGHLDGSGLAAFLETAMAARSRHNMLHPMMWFKPRQPYFAAFEALSGLVGDEAERAAYRLLDGVETPLTRLTDELYRLAEAARRIPAVFQWLHDLDEEDFSETGSELAAYPYEVQGAGGWWAHFQEFLAEFGDRNGHGYGSEALLSTPTWRDCPALAVQHIVQFLDERVEAPWRQRERTHERIEKEVQSLYAQCLDAKIKAEFLRQLEYARRSQAVVEVHNHHIEQVGNGQLRRAVIAAAEWLQITGVLAKVSDIFWLDFSEILAALRGQGQASLNERILERKAQHKEWAGYTPPPYLGLPSADLPDRPSIEQAVEIENSRDDDVIQGVGASAGSARGRARVVASGDPSPLVEPGDILVAENAGPLWLPFFPILGGIVLETGSLGQHAASTAREYGLPAVLGASNASKIIKNGDWITVNGIAGIVELDKNFNK